MSWINTKGTNMNITAHSSDVQQCLHDGCPECHGTGLKSDNSFCVHNISCPCSKCSPRFFGAVAEGNLLDLPNASMRVVTNPRELI